MGFTCRGYGNAINRALNQPRQWGLACECKYARGVGRNGKGSKRVHEAKAQRRKINARMHGQEPQWKQFNRFATAGSW